MMEPLSDFLDDIIIQVDVEYRYRQGNHKFENELEYLIEEREEKELRKILRFLLRIRLALADPIQERDKLQELLDDEEAI